MRSVASHAAGYVLAVLSAAMESFLAQEQPAVPLQPQVTHSRLAVASAHETARAVVAADAPASSLNCR